MPSSTPESPTILMTAKSLLVSSGAGRTERAIVNDGCESHTSDESRYGLSPRHSNHFRVSVFFLNLEHGSKDVQIGDENVMMPMLTSTS